MSDPTQYRLKNRNETPNGGWQYFQPETVWTAPFVMSDTFDVAVRKIMYHRAGNARFNLATDYDTVANQFEHYMCTILIQRGLGEVYVAGFEKKTTHPARPEPTSTMQRAAGAVVGLVAEVKKDAIGAASLAEWIGDGSIPVHQDQADARSAICLKCPQNKARGGRLKEMVASAITAYTKVKNQLGLHANGEEGLKTCAACDCPLKLKVWVPLKYILSHTNPGIFPDNCWVPKELKSDGNEFTPPQPPSPTAPIVTIQRWGAFGDVITATALATRIKARGFRVRFATHQAMMPAIAGHPDIDEMVEHGTVTADINLDGAYERHPDNRSRPILSLFEETARKQIPNAEKVLGNNGHYRPMVVVTDEEKAPFIKLFSSFKKPWVVIVPRSGKWKNRSVPDEIWKETARLVNGTCFWTGYERIDTPIIDLGTREFRKVMAAIAAADLVVTVDTGPMHVAAALKKPILAIQQAFDLSLRLSPDADWSAFSPPLTCLKCGQFECPIDRNDPPCTKLNTVDLAMAINNRTSSRTTLVEPVKKLLPTVFDGHVKGYIKRAVNAADYVTVVLRVHKRHQHVEAALQSILKAGLTKIVITASGGGIELEQWLNKQEKSGHTVILNEGGNSNDHWLAGISEVTTPFTILCHDDDLMLPEYTDKLIPLVTGEADFSVCNQTGSANDFLMKTGVRNSRVVHDEVLRQKLSLSPARGCFPTEKLLEWLSEWKDTYDRDRQFEQDGVVTGNDLLIWLKSASMLARCLVISDQCVSTNNSGSRPAGLERIYRTVRERHSTCRVPNYCGLGYIHNWERASGMVRSLTRSKPGAGIIWFSDSNERASVPYERIPRIGPLPGGVDVKFVSASIAFVYGLRMIRDRNIDWFMWLEHDCRFRGDRWMVQLWQENLSWMWNHVCSGSPVIWNLPGYGTKLATAWLPWFGKYSSETGFFPAFEGWGGGQPSAYPNGALAWYHTETMCDWFSAPLAMDHAGIQKWCMENTTFDLYIGQQLIKRYGVTAAMKMGWLESAYSGCGEHYYHAEARRKLLETQVIAMHQEKDNSK